MSSALVSAALIALVVPLVMRWLARGAATAGVRGTLAYGPKPRLFATIVAVVAMLFDVALVLAVPVRNASDAVACAAIVLVMAILPIPLLLEVYRVRIGYDNHAIEVRSPWSRRRSIAWRDVKVVRWRGVAKWLALSDGRQVVNVPCGLAGLDEFARAVNAHVVPEVLSAEEAVKNVLALMEQGREWELVMAPPGGARR